MNIVHVMCSCAARERERLETLAALSAVGVAPRVFTSDLPRGMSNVIDNQRNALHWALQQGTSHVGFWEDDLLVASWLPSAIEESVNSGFPVVTLYVAGKTFYPAEVRNQQPVKRGIYRLKNRRNYYGSQALVMTAAACEDALRLMERPAPLDISLSEVLMALIPNPIQHMGVRSAWSAHAWRRKTIYFQQDAPDA